MRLNAGPVNYRLSENYTFLTFRGASQAPTVCRPPATVCRHRRLP